MTSKYHRESTVAVAALCLALAFGSRASDVEVVKEGAVKAGVDLSELQCVGDTAGRFRTVLAGDLERSGWFTLVGAGRGIVVVRGHGEEQGGELAVSCTVQNRALGKTYLKKTFRERSDQWRRLAHLVADEILWAVRQKKGIAATRIAMIGAHGGRKDLYLCDADGGGVVRVTRDEAACLSPAWLADAEGLVYTSFCRQFPDVYRIDLARGTREQLVHYPGLNSGADVSPDGRSIVLTLSKDGNPDLYVMDLKSRQLTRVTRTRYAAEASPSWSPDGRRIVFVSDKSGSPQLYVADRRSDRQDRLTFRGSENVAPDWGPANGIAFSSRRDGVYCIGVIDPSTRGETQLTSDYADYEDPSWAPNGRHIVCSRTVSYKSDLYVLDTLGDAPLRLTSSEGSWYSPAWSPR